MGTTQSNLPFDSILLDQHFSNRFIVLFFSLKKIKEFIDDFIKNCQRNSFLKYFWDFFGLHNIRCIIMLMINHYQKVSCKKMFFATKILGQGYRVANNKLTYFS